MTTIDTEQLRGRIVAARDKNPGLARRLTDELIAASTSRPIPPAPAPSRRPEAARPPRRERCPDCHGPAGHYRQSRCATCHKWRLNGRHRTPADRERQPRYCSNCACEMETGRMRRRGRCEACARYWDRNGRERPRRLYEAPPRRRRDQGGGAT